MIVERSNVRNVTCQENDKRICSQKRGLVVVGGGTSANNMSNRDSGFPDAILVQKIIEITIEHV